MHIDELESIERSKTDVLTRRFGWTVVLLGFGLSLFGGARVDLLLPLRATAVVERRDWMKKGNFTDLRLSEMLLPGTHDSGAYDFQVEGINHQTNDNGVFLKLAEMVKAANSRLLVKTIERWSQTQQLTVYEQLTMGIRYLDLRIYYTGHMWVTEHFLLAVPLEDLLLDVKRFTEENPEEVIVLDATHVYIPEGHYAQTCRILMNLYSKYLGPYIYQPTKGWSKRNQIFDETLGFLTQDGQRIITLFQQKCSNSERSGLDSGGVFHNIWPDTSAARYLPALVEQGVINSMASEVPKLLRMNWALTTNLSSILRSITILVGFQPRCLRHMAELANPKVIPFLRKMQEKGIKLAGVLTVDYVDFSDFIPEIIAINEARRDALRVNSTDVWSIVRSR